MLLWRHGLSLSRLRPSCGYPSFVDYNPGAGRPVFGESPSETPRHAAHRLAKRAVEVHYGSKRESSSDRLMSASVSCGHAVAKAWDRVVPLATEMPTRHEGRNMPVVDDLI